MQNKPTSAQGYGGQANKSQNDPQKAGQKIPTQSAQAGPPKSSSDTIERLVRENLTLTKEIIEHTRKTRRYILYGHIFNVVKIVLIVGPIILAILYLPPLLEQVFGTYSELLGGGTGQTLLEGNSFINKLFQNTNN